MRYRRDVESAARLNMNRSLGLLLMLLSLSGMPVLADTCPAAKTVNWIKTLGADPRTRDLVQVADLSAVPVGRVGDTTLAFVPIAFGGSAGVQTLLTYRITPPKECTSPQVDLLGTFKTETSLIQVYFKAGNVHFVTLTHQSEHSLKHPTDFLDSEYRLQDGKLAKISGKEFTSDKLP
jgi:hypothetical protein